MNTIPVVDFGKFSNDTQNTNAKEFSKDVGEALRDVGFMAVSNHGINLKLIERCYEFIDRLFQLPQEQLKKYEDLKLKGQRGFTSFGREHAKDQPLPDLKEFWHIGQELIAQKNLGYPDNIWPTELEGFKESFMTLYSELERVAFGLLRACSQFINESPEIFSGMAKDGNSILRLIHYPPIEDAKTKSVRAAAHEDINLITLLIDATASGLQILTRENQWVDVVTPQNCIIADAGDMLQNVTNGYFKSTTHRVINPDDFATRRFSMPFFVHARSEVDLSPLNSCIKATGGEKKFPNQTAGEYLSKRLEEIGLS